MIILSHRGYWKSAIEKNDEIAFKRSFYLGYGTETDIRDHDGRLVISHDPASNNSMSIDEFFKIYKCYEELPLAINVKADGLQNLLIDALQRYQVSNYFVFDMSVPDALIYLEKGLNVYTRQSEYEMQTSFYDRAQGVWIDCFENDWVDEEIIVGHLNNGKKVCLVSPDLHNREYEFFWSRLLKMGVIENDNLMLCTDYPEEAKIFFVKGKVNNND